MNIPIRGNCVTTTVHHHHWLFFRACLTKFFVYRWPGFSWSIGLFTFWPPLSTKLYWPNLSKHLKRLIESTYTTMAFTLISLLLILANDIERNPGPGSGGGGNGTNSGVDRKCDKLERLVTEVQREVKNLKKAVDSVSGQMDAQTVRERPKMASLIEEINVIKETMSVQVKK